MISLYKNKFYKRLFYSMILFLFFNLSCNFFEKNINDTINSNDTLKIINQKIDIPKSFIDFFKTIDKSDFLIENNFDDYKGKLLNKKYKFQIKP